MDFRNIRASARPVYTWFWNSKITREGIKREIDEMYDSGIRGFYVLGEPEGFRPFSRATHLSPEYLSDEYLDLLYYAYELAKEKGMEFWLYNEGGFPSGMVCGKIINQRPDLGKKNVGYREFRITKNEKYSIKEDSIVAFVNGEQIKNGFVTDAEGGVVVGEYYMADQPDRPMVNSDIARRETTDLFLEMTHEVLKEKFGDVMGREVTFMFDDEAHMGLWTRGLDKMFAEKYGYEIYPYMGCISLRKNPETDEEYRAVSDYAMLCGELTVNNYFSPMKTWLNEHNMLSVGHLDCESCTKNLRVTLYGNMMESYRAFDVPGIDVIWSQITYPDENGETCFEGNRFFPRYASSAARQCGHSLCLSETFAVHGGHIAPEEMRFDVNYQAVRGISIFNFMTISYDRETPMCLQYRPNFIPESPGMDNLHEINEYTGRVSHILQCSKADIRTALYFPCRSIIAGGKRGQCAAAAYDALGARLESLGVSFDIIDESLVRKMKLEGTSLIGDHVRYDNVFLPDNCFLESEDVLEKLALVGKNIEPCIERESPYTQARKLIFEDGSEGYLICNFANETVNEKICIRSNKTPYIVEIQSGETYLARYERDGEFIRLDATILRGDGFLLYLTDQEINAVSAPEFESVCEIKNINSYISRRYIIDSQKGPQNLYPERADRKDPLAPFDDDFSGEVTYETVVGEDVSDAYIELGEVNHWTKIFVNGKKVAAVTMPPYRAALGDIKKGDEIKIVVANTVAQACRNSDYFDVQEKRDVGPYHDKMKVLEARAPVGGLVGPIKILKKIN